MTFYWLDSEFLHNSLIQWGVFAGALLFLGFALALTKKIIGARLEKLAPVTETDWDDLALNLLKTTRFFFLLATAFYLSSLVLDRSPQVARVSKSVYIIFALIQAGFWGMNLIEFAIQRVIHSKSRENGEVDSALATTLPTIRFFASIFLYSLLVLLALDNLGINVTALLAGLGVGGIAVALAAQNILGDIFASLSIVIDKPFVIGDLITVGNHQGTVEKIGLKTTRLRSVTGEQLIVSNADMLQSRIQNFKRMQERRVTFTLGITYDTAPSKLEKIPSIVRHIISSQEYTRFDRAHFKTFGPSSLDFEIVYWIENPEIGIYMNTQQTINFEILKSFAQEQIQFAYPTQTLIVQSSAQNGRSAA